MISPTLQAHAHVYHPSGGQLFPSNSTLASAFDAVLTSLQNAGKLVRKDGTQLSYFIPIFRKFQFMVLNDLYNYLTSVYTTFSLTHIDQVNRYLTSEPTFALNKKSLIITHLLNVIQAQMYFICSHHIPLVPKHFGLKTGSLMLQHDYTGDPTFLIRDFDQPFFPEDLTTPDQQAMHDAFKQTQAVYLQTLSTILDFFSSYTGYLARPAQAGQAHNLPGSNAFVPLAAHIAQVMEADPFNQRAREIARQPSPSTGTATPLPKIRALRALRNARVQPINPPLFYYDKDVLRALRVIPQAAHEIPPNSTIIGWPAHLVKAAQTRKPATTQGEPDLQHPGRYLPGKPLGYVIAYFEDAHGRRTTNIQQAAKLFINLPTVDGPYAQEIKRQPSWLNSSHGVIAMLRGCLGDYTQLIGMGALSPCAEQIICRAKNLPCGKTAAASCQAELKRITSIQQQYIQALKTGQDPLQAQHEAITTSTATETITTTTQTSISGYLTPGGTSGGTSITIGTAGESDGGITIST
jgi:hypothetical protein